MQIFVEQRGGLESAWDLCGMNIYPSKAHEENLVRLRFDLVLPSTVLCISNGGSKGKKYQGPTADHNFSVLPKENLGSYNLMQWP